MRFGLILGEALTGLRRNASMVISVVLVTFVSLTFVGAAILMQAQIGTMRAYWQDRAQVAIYMCSSVSTSPGCVGGVATDDQIKAVQAELDGATLKPLISKSTFQTADQAYQETLKLVGKDYAGGCSRPTRSTPSSRSTSRIRRSRPSSPRRSTTSRAWTR